MPGAAPGPRHFCGDGPGQGYICDRPDWGWSSGSLLWAVAPGHSDQTSGSKDGLRPLEQPHHYMFWAIHEQLLHTDCALITLWQRGQQYKQVKVLSIHPLGVNTIFQVLSALPLCLGWYLNCTWSSSLCLHLADRKLPDCAVIAFSLQSQQPALHCWPGALPGPTSSSAVPVELWEDWPGSKLCWSFNSIKCWCAALRGVPSNGDFVSTAHMSSTWSMEHLQLHQSWVLK